MSGKVEQTRLIADLVAAGASLTAALMWRKIVPHFRHLNLLLFYFTLLFCIIFSILATNQAISWINSLDFNASQSPGKDLNVLQALNAP